MRKHIHLLIFAFFPPKVHCHERACVFQLYLIFFVANEAGLSLTIVPSFYVFGQFFFFFSIVPSRLLYTIFFLTKSAKKVRLLFLRGLEARRGFFGRNELKIEVSSLYCPGRVPGHQLVS